MFITTTRIRRARQNVLDDHDITPNGQDLVEVMVCGEPRAIVNLTGGTRVLWHEPKYAETAIIAAVEACLPLMQCASPVVAQAA